MPDRPARNTKIVGPVLPNRSHVRTPDRLLSRVPGDGGGHGRDRSGRRRADGYQALRIAESCAAQDARRPALLELVADMAARDRRRTLPALHDFARRLGVPA
jgi:hypothetical protein